MGNSDHGTTYLRVGGDDWELLSLTLNRYDANDADSVGEEITSLNSYRYGRY
jgi:hypothetical protein